MREGKWRKSRKTVTSSVKEKEEKGEIGTQVGHEKMA